MKKISCFILFALVAYSCDPCKDVNCNQGKCVEGSCECNPGWTGVNCDVDLCANVNCNHGSCEEGMCQCDENYQGPYCDQIIDPCYEVDCGNHGSCSGGVCICDPGWDGSDCTMEDLCFNVDCSNHGDCVDGNCDCNANWSGANCDVCANDCGTHGECGDDGLCDCDPGWTGSDCATEEPAGICSNTCTWADDGDCDDGGPGSDYSVCTCGTDCQDCGTRSESDCESGGNGTLGVWTSLSTFPCNTTLIDVYVDDAYVGAIDDYFNTTPACGDIGVVTVSLFAGSHTLYAECNSGTTYWGPGTITIYDGYCTLIELIEKKNFVTIVKERIKK
jgi:hypothetical protein